MISFATLGSRIADDCINRNKDFENKLRVVQISPISVLGKKLPEGFLPRAACSQLSNSLLTSHSQYRIIALRWNLIKTLSERVGKVRKAL